MSWIAVGVGVGGAVIGGAMSSNAAGKAADAQSEASAQSNALQRYMFDQNQALQMPTINTGNAARDRLSYLLGLSPTGYSGGAGGGSAPALTYEQLRAQLQGQYTRAGGTGGAPGYSPSSPADAYNYLTDGRNVANALAQQNQAGHWENQDYGGPGERRWVPDATPQGASTIDETGLDAEIRRRLAEQDAQRQAAIDAAKNDPNYGRLAQQFEFGTYTPDKFSYTGQDLYDDPSYKFRLDQGQKALDRQGAAAGRFLSGRQLQASSDYNQGAASQEFQNAYQRALGTFSTNEGNRYNAFNTNEGNRFNAYQANFNNAVNPLLALSGAATLGSQNLGSAGASMANQVGNNLTNNANAQGAAGIASANSFNSGLSNVSNTYNQNQLMNSLLNRGSVNNNPTSNLIDTLGSSNNMWGTGSNP